MEANEDKSRRERLSLVRIYDELAGSGYDGGYDAVRRCAASWRRRRSGSAGQAHVPLTFDPGEAYPFDWSHEYAVIVGATVRVKAAHMRLCHSRVFLVQIFPREGQEMAFEAHERSLRFFGGVCRRGIYDNRKTAVQTVFVGKERVFSERFLQMCSHHLVDPVACTVVCGGQRQASGSVPGGGEAAPASGVQGQDGVGGVRGRAALSDGLPGTVRWLPGRRDGC